MFIRASFAFIFHLLLLMVAICPASAVPRVSSPEAIGDIPPTCPANQQDLGCGCGNPGPSGCDNHCGSSLRDTGCGCGNPPADLCGVCGGNGLSCRSCNITDCSGATIPNVENYCSLDVNRDGKIDSADVAIVRAGIPANSISSVTPETRHLDIDRDGFLSPYDISAVRIFIARPPAGVIRPDDCGVCGGPGYNSCGFCPSDPNFREDRGCGCNANPDSCGRCPGRPWYGTTCEPSTCPPDVFGVHVTSNIHTDYGLSPLNWTEIRALGRSSKRGACLNQHLDEALRVCPAIVAAMGAGGTDVTVVNGRATNNLDDCVAGYFTGGYYTTTFPQIRHFIIKEIDPHFDGLVFFNERCENIPPPPETAVNSCLISNLEYYASPISLIFDEEQRPTSVVVSFNLGGGECKACVSEWRASDKAPLLVYDPEHKRSITHAGQLFGNFAFGGNRVASLKAQSISSSQWRNGYEALATLDLDHNGEVEGEELSSLALWFDGDRDAISQPAEVKLLTEVGVTKLFYKDAQPVVNSRDVQLPIGYQREVDGRVVTGRSIDWYGAVASSVEELVSRRAVSIGAAAPSEQRDANKIDRADSTSFQVTRVGFEGMWEWSGKLKGKTPSFGGVLAFSKRDGKGRVLSFSEVTLESKKQPDFKSVVLKSGDVRSNDDGSYTFSLQSKDQGISTRFNYIEASDTIEGETTLSNSRSKLVYRWIGHRRVERAGTTAKSKK